MGAAVIIGILLKHSKSLPDIERGLGTHLFQVLVRAALVPLELILHLCVFALEVIPLHLTLVQDVNLLNHGWDRGIDMGCALARDMDI